MKQEGHATHGNTTFTMVSDIYIERKIVPMNYPTL